MRNIISDPGLVMKDKDFIEFSNSYIKNVFIHKELFIENICYFPVNDAYMIVNNDNIYIYPESFSNSIFIIILKDVKLFESIIFPDYMKILFMKQEKTYIDLIMETSELRTLDAYALFSEYDFEIL